MATGSALSIEVTQCEKIMMLIFLRKDISMFSSLWRAIYSFFGFSSHIAKFASIKTGLGRPILMSEIEIEDIKRVGRMIGKLNWIVGPELERLEYFRTNKLKTIKTYRAMRLRQGLPNRGQRTHTNAKTARRLKGMWEKSSFAKRMEKKKKKLFV